jgi:acetoin utilization deacetylase AcuC-like enzyme
VPPGATAPTAVYFHPRFLEHDTGDHPESADRLVVVRGALEASGLPLRWVTPHPASIEAVARVHAADYIRHLATLASSGGGRLDWDTVVSPASYEAALLAAGAGVDAVGRAVEAGERSFLLVRPPGHHALYSRGMGFCLLNNIAVAATNALEELGLERVLIVDWDVHHGNGTQDAFFADRRVLFISMHQSHHYPGTGGREEVGVREGAGYTVNVPFAQGAGDGAALSLFRELVEPLARRFRPQLILASTGFDSQEGDPLGGLRLSAAAFQWMAARLAAMAEELGAAGPVCFLEGGYDPELMARSVVATIRGLQGDEPLFVPEVEPAEEAAVSAALESVRSYWPGVLRPS